MMASRLIFYLILPLIFFSCKNSCSLNPKEYAAWVTNVDNNIHKKKSIQDLNFDIQYQPSELMLLNEFRGVLPKNQVWKQKLEELNGLIYFKLKISTVNKTDLIRRNIKTEKEYYQNLYYYSFDFQKNITLQQGITKSDCKLFHFERDYGLTNERIFLMAFDNLNNCDNKTLIIDSNVLSVGNIKIEFDKTTLASIPSINSTLYEKN